jgi:hypothetical protein
MEKAVRGKPQFGATERSQSMYKNVCTLSNTLAWGRLGSIPPWEPASRFTSAIERSGKWKKVR